MAKRVETNTDRARSLAARVREPKFMLGSTVREPYGEVGVVDKVFADLDAAFDSGELGCLSPERWYEAQRVQPKTPTSGVWYGVILYDHADRGDGVTGGSVLVGEDDLVPVESPT